MKTTDVRRDMPLLDKVIYLDAASTTPTPKPVIESMNNYFYNYNANTGREPIEWLLGQPRNWNWQGKNC